MEKRINERERKKKCSAILPMEGGAHIYKNFARTEIPSFARYMPGNNFRFYCSVLKCLCVCDHNGQTKLKTQM